MDDILQVAHLVLPATPRRWETLVECWPAELLNQPAAPGEWSAAACLRHLVHAELVAFPARVQAFLDGRDFEPFDPSAQDHSLYPDPSPLGLGRQFLQLRGLSLQRVGRLTASDLVRSVRHPELGPVTLSQLVHEWVAHDLMHTVQAERALMQPFIAGCEPWRRYFADHDLSRVDAGPAQ